MLKYSIFLSFVFFAFATMGCKTIKEADSSKGITIHTYQINVNIVSGSKEGQQASGTFSFTTSEYKDQLGPTQTKATAFHFTYDGDTYTLKDGPATIKLRNGEFISLHFVGGPQHKRFGINDGFQRNQFGRSNEAFVRQGEQYFGYLNPQTYVDGVGTITYKKM